MENFCWCGRRFMWIVASPCIAACVAWKGTTPGKLLFSLRVVSHDGALNYRTALRREAYLLIWGIGLGIPLLSLIMLIPQLQRNRACGRCQVG